MPSDKVRLSLDVSPELNSLLESLATRTGGTKSDVLRKAIALMDVAVDAKEGGKRLLLVDKPNAVTDDPRLVTEIVGL